MCCNMTSDFWFQFLRDPAVSADGFGYQCTLLDVAGAAVPSTEAVPSVLEFPHVKTAYVRNLGRRLTSSRIADGLKSATTVDLSGNAISAFLDFTPAEWIDKVVLDSNQIEVAHIPSESDAALFGRFLHHLSISRNSLHDMAGMSCLRSLRVLNMSHNSLVSFPPDVFQDMHSLRVLDLSFNGISKLTGLEHVAQSLEELYCSHNQIDTLAALGEREFPRLRVLDLAQNMLPLWAQARDILKPLSLLRDLRLAPNPFAVVISDTYRFEVLFHVSQISVLDGETVTAEQKVKARLYFQKFNQETDETPLVFPKSAR